MISDPEQVPPGVDSTRPSPARLYDYYLGGTNNFEVDRMAAEQIRQQLPELADAAWANRGFHGRAAAWMATEHGIDQFIDIGSGLPTQNNTHEVVRKLLPGARVAYVDIDPMVAAHGAELLAGDGSSAVITADLRDPATVLADPELHRLIDLSKPVGVLMTAVIHFVEDEADPWGVVTQYMKAVVPGSFLALSHVTYERLPPQAVQTGQDVYARATNDIHLRSHAEVERFFTGLELVPPYRDGQPGLCYVGSWGADDPGQADSDGSRVFYCGVARRPASMS
ncbi:MAG TPA: SAM-dependent methyltransferase [Streptosporangiaceae bacterium]